MLRRIEQLLLDLAVVAVIGLGVLITATVLLRVFFNSGVPDAIVMVRELMVAAIVLPLGRHHGTDGPISPWNSYRTGCPKTGRGHWS